MPHGDAVIDRDGVELLGYATGSLDLTRDQLSHVFQMDVAGHELRERVGDGDDGFAEVAIGHAGGAPQGTRTRHVAAMGGGFGTVCGHDVNSDGLK
jgi:hypothetical protein